MILIAEETGYTLTALDGIEGTCKDQDIQFQVAKPLRGSRLVVAMNVLWRNVLQRSHRVCRGMNADYYLKNIIIEVVRSYCSFCGTKSFIRAK